MPPKIRRTPIAKRDEPSSLGHDLALSGNTPREIAAARRLVERAARDETDRDLLMAALGLPAAAVYLALLTYTAAYLTWAHHTRRGNR